MPYALDPLSPESLKAEARVLRAEYSADGKSISHGEALERVAHAHGYRDWNTARACLPQRIGCPVTIGERVSGTYLKQPFTGTVLSVSILPGQQHFRIRIHFDAPVDVVTFDSFSAFRQRVFATVDPYGVSPAKTSDGEPHMRLMLRRR